MYLKPEFACLLQNNDAPSESTILEVTESLKAPLNELQEVEAEIERLGEIMETMKMKRQSIQKIINDHNIILSPTRRLPPDVLHEIFFHCLPTHRNPIIKYSESPLLLTQICSSWRAIALSSPRIWSKVYIPLPGDPSFSSSHGIITDEITLSIRRQRFAGVMRSRCDTIRRWLSRSGTCPLSLSVTYPGYYSILEDSDDELAHEMFNVLLSFADRWGDVDLSMPESIYNKLQCDINPTMLSSLKSLKIDLYRKSTWDSTTPAPIRLLAAPGLRRITISAIQTLDMTGNLAQSIWNHITHITFASSITDIYLLVLLRQCPNLVFGKFIVQSSPWLDQIIGDQGEVLLPRLESLAINDSDSHENMKIVFHSIKAPALTRLSYQAFERDLEYNSTIPFLTPVLPLLENSTLINDLSLDGGLSSQDTQECLRRGAHVTHIVFGKPPGANAHPHRSPHLDIFDLRILSIGPLGVSPLPRLESLEAYQLSSLTDEDLLDVITSRINTFKQGETAALKSVKISFQRRRQKDITEDVSRIAKEAGIEVKLGLTYLPEEPDHELLKHLSPSFGLPSDDDVIS